MLSSLATTGIAFCVAVITWNNWITNKGALREKLFERRFAVFGETQIFLTMLTENDKQLDEAIGPFSDTFQRSRFLCGHAVHEYLEVIRLKAFDTQFQKTVMANPVDYDDSQQHIKKYSETKIWYHKQLTVIFEKFDPFLSFEKNR